MAATVDMDIEVAYVLTGYAPNQAPANITSPFYKIKIFKLRDIINAYPNLPQVGSHAVVWDYSNYENRLATFIPGWTVEFITPEQMARAGFYYTGIRDKVRCLFCSSQIDQWEPVDDPMEEHRRNSPQCAFFRQDQGYDVCGSYDPPQRDLLVNPHIIKIKAFLDAVSVEQKNTIVPNSKAFTSTDSRLRSFERCSRAINQDIYTLCLSGLYYMGDGENDKMLCYCCNQGLKDWELSDDPWLEHARWSPYCTYITLLKGKEFVNEARSQLPNVAQNNDPGVDTTDSKDDPVEEENAVSLLEENAINMPEENAINLPEENAIDLPEENAISLPEENAISLPEENAISLPEGNSDVVEDQIEANKCGSPQDMMYHSSLCKICLKEKIEVMLIPCGHVIACIECSVTLNYCALCRQHVHSIMKVFIYVDEEKENYPNQLKCYTSKGSDEPVDPVLCKICGIEEMGIAFAPCRHVCACFECSKTMKECPLCLEPFFAMFQVYL